MGTRQLTRTYIVRAVIVVFLAVLLGYTLFQARHLLLGPIITIKTPENGELFPTSLAKIEGSAKNVSEITLNDRLIFTDEKGSFKEQLLLQKGYTIMTIKAKDRFGRSTEKTLHLVRN